MFMKFSIVPKFLGIYHQQETVKTELNYLGVLNFLYLNLLQRDGKFLSDKSRAHFQTVSNTVHSWI